jgi:ABC-2 type transport system permease protein
MTRTLPADGDALARITLVVRKELTQALRTRMAVWTIALTTLAFILLPLGIAVATTLVPPGQMNSSSSEQLMAVARMQFPALAGLTEQQLFQAIMLSAMQTLFLVIPLMIPLIIAVYSIIGEKQTRTLEALLATPITTGELLAGKCLAAVVPGVLSAWVSYALFILAALPFVPPATLSSILLRPAWLLSLGLLAPGMAGLAVVAGLMVSSRATDAQAAQQVAGLIILPVVGLMLGQFAGVVQLSPLLVLVAAVVLFAVDAGLLALAVRLFQRETILTRWK